MKLSPEARAELQAYEPKPRGRRVKKRPNTSILTQAAERKGATRGTSLAVASMKAPK